jgi:Thioredoxin
MSWHHVAISLLVTSLLPSVAAAQDVDYAALYDRGVPFATFLERARSRRTEWIGNFERAKPDEAALARARALPERRRILVVAEDWCADSLNTVPYLAKLVDAVPDRLELRVIDSTVGKEVMEANRTADGRSATPTIVVLGADGRPVGAWVERPSVLQKWFTEQKPLVAREELLEGKAKWYAEDAGKSTVAEIVTILEGAGRDKADAPAAEVR